MKNYIVARIEEYPAATVNAATKILGFGPSGALRRYDVSELQTIITAPILGLYVDALVQYGSGTEFTKATIDAALLGIGTVNKFTLLLQPGTWVIDANADWSVYKNVTFLILPGAILQIATGITTTIGGPFSAGLHQVFNCVGTGSVTFGSGTMKSSYPQWWYDGSGNWTHAIQSAIKSYPTVGFVNGSYPVQFDDTITPYHVLFPVKSNATILFDTGAIITPTGSTPDYGGIFGIDKASIPVCNVKFLNVRVECATNLPISGVQLASNLNDLAASITNIVIDNAHFENMSNGVFAIQSSEIGGLGFQIKGLKITNSFITEMLDGAGICICCEDGLVEGNTIIGSIINHATTYDGINIISGTNIRSVSNRISYFRENGITIRSSIENHNGAIGMVISGNEISDCSLRGISVTLSDEDTYGVQRITISNNSIYSTVVGSISIFVSKGSNGTAPLSYITISGNTVHSSYGIECNGYYGNANDLVITGNNITTSAVDIGFGLSINGFINFTVTGNKIDSLGASTLTYLAFELLESIQGIISGNVINGPLGYDSITISSNCQQLSITGNWIYGKWNFAPQKTVMSGNRIEITGTLLARVILATEFIGMDTWGVVTVRGDNNAGAPLVTGTWVLGDHVLSKGIAIGMPKAWTCSTPGAYPGVAVFTSEGNLSGNFYWSCPGVHFAASYPAVGDVMKSSDGEILVQADTIYLRAAVSLPDGAIVTSAKVFGNAASEDSLWVLRAVTLLSKAVTGMASANINAEDTSIGLSTVDNSLYAYFIYTNAMMTNDEIYGARVGYIL